RRLEHFDGDREAKYRGFSLAEQLRQKFLWKYGSLVCHRVQEKIMGSSFDLRVPEEREKFEEAGAHRDRCTGVVSDVARWTVRLISSIDGK
ncbi:C_GCAxxG_C_C family protein, partial [bacterium]|nr:C_GCAxxG_C_C family protein [bacterium]